MAVPLLIGLGLVATILLLRAERAGNQGWIGVWKMAAATGYVALAWSQGAGTSEFGRWMLAAFLCSWAGDAALLRDRRPTLFFAGLGAFLAAHLAFFVAFLFLRPDPVAIAGCGVVVAASFVPVVRWLWPHLPPPMKTPVMFYLVAIGGMVSAALAVALADRHFLFALAALAFAASDVAVARHQFVAPGFSNKQWGLPLYFGAQYLFAYAAGWGG